jgi:diguanylate cyclase (GGDEF)-like protein
MDPAFMDRQGGGTPKDPETLRLLGVSAAIVVPLSSRGELLGVAVVMARDRPERLSWSPELSARIAGVAAQATVALENGRLLDAVTHQARHDRLTGLANRVQFGADLDEAVARSGREGELVALFYLDLDEFKAVNDELGHAVGDELLVEVAARLLQETRVGDAVARLGGDEFAIVASAPSTRELDRIATRIAAAFDAPFEMHGRRVRLSVSVGRAVFPSDARDATELLRLADAAMYRRKADTSRPRRSS